MSTLEGIIVGAFVLYAVIYLARYVRASIQGKRSGCGCGNESGCPSKKE